MNKNIRVAAFVAMIALINPMAAQAGRDGKLGRLWEEKYNLVIGGIAADFAVKFLQFSYFATELVLDGDTKTFTPVDAAKLVVRGLALAYVTHKTLWPSIKRVWNGQEDATEEKSTK